MQLIVSELFEERPIWPRWSLYERLIDDGLEVTENQLKRLLFRTGYYFSHGPYGKFWIRKGYDPRKDPESRIYQKVDFRVPPKLRYLTDVNTKKGSKQTWKDVCQFQVMPMKNFVLQFFELVDDSIQQEIRKPTDQTKCTFPTGWFSVTRLKTLGLLVKMKFLSLFPKGSADDLLRTTSERIKRFKQQEVLHISERLKKSMEQEVVHTCSQPGKEHQIMNRESNAPEDELEGQGDKCEIENDDDDEEEEMDFDGYASSPVAGEDDNLSPRTCSYQIDESIPNDYLQEILRGFPVGNDGRDPKRMGAEDADLSDDAFQIYEQDSDGNYDD
ncbi:general transcription factor 3C polypeptide 5-like isoform X1 [Iris pallida]|uniref:General transcription factor 3C polypeptide 5-like isoform X1 n=1 Tax=Iris pallida TaxID=29817 RepID=A0AAX6EP36_IRIPA|nr:general transcription factor 3C polypeptide 5-like isoform X1 [Iris pallida]KAJ6816432.1 general transcription factor 3C polypeptide 5-like isoform X1 [Iris pallida]